MTDKQSETLRLADELRRLEKDYVARDAELRRLHEVNAVLMRLVEEAYWLLEDNIQNHGIKHEMLVAMDKVKGKQ